MKKKIVMEKTSKYFNAKKDLKEALVYNSSLPGIWMDNCERILIESNGSNGGISDIMNTT